MDEKDLEQKEQPPVKWATPIQRLWAWIGVVYMIMLVLLTTYALAYGNYLRGIGGIMLSPALVGLGGSAILNFRQGRGRGGLPACVLISAAAFGLALWNLIRDFPALLSQL